LNFLHRSLEVGEALRRSHAGAAFVQSDAGIRDPLIDRLRNRFLLFAQGGLAPVQFSLQVGRLIGVPSGIIEPGFINWKGRYFRLR
jgi:hypothetical protein